MASYLAALRQRKETTAAVYCLSFIALGWGIALAGPSILQLSAATESPVSTVGYIIGLRSLAYLAGGFMGFLFDKVPGHLLIGVALALGGAATAAVPAARNLGVLAVALISQGFFLCIIDAGANVMLLWLLAGEASMPAWLQMLHFCFALGALCAPLALRAAASANAGGSTNPTVLADGSEVVIEVVGASDAAWYACASLCLVAALVLVFVLPPARKRKSAAELAEGRAVEASEKLPSGAEAAAVPASPPGVATLAAQAQAPAWDGSGLELTPATASATAPPLPGTPPPPPPPPPALLLPPPPPPPAPAPPALDTATVRALALQTWGVVANVSLLFFFYVGCEVGFGLFITAFAVLTIGMSEASAQLLTAAYWGAITAGRLLAVPLSSRLAAETMMSLDIVGVCASLALLVALQGSAVGLWLAVVLFGLSMASIYPTGVAILEAFVPLEGKHTTSLVIGGSAGEWLLPFIIASFMQAEVEGGGAIAVTAADAARARWVFLGVGATACLGMFATYALLRRLGPALRERRRALGLP